MRDDLRKPYSNFAVSLTPARDSRAESVHLKPFATHNFESDTVL
jgi:hypothetical protein